MREILFTGKRVDNGEWVEGFYVFVPEHYKPEMSRKSYIVSINNGFFFEVIPETVGQYIGMTDKNGKKIFKGSIIECNVFGAMATGKHKKYLVVFYNGTYFAQWSIGERKFSAYMNETWARNVVGNKWDNPELLEVMR